VREYYDRRAPEYDDWYLGSGRFDQEERPGFDGELAETTRVLAALRPARVLDVACGTGFLTRHLRGDIVGLDQSEAMLGIARNQVPTASFVQGNALALPFADESFERVVAAHFYGHLPDPDRVTVLAEVRRVADELIVVDSALRERVARAEVQERILKDGSRWDVYKRYFTPDELSAELGDGTVLFAGRWFVVVQARVDGRWT
jgi:demethylmenaquinone methyltransferase/2-methoxy-6-polyprenyl-1,4-benzoquinol methylase